MNQYTYPDFEGKIKTALRQVMDRYNLKVVSGSTSNFSELVLGNDACELKFVYDYGQLSCLLINPWRRTNFIYPVYSVLMFLYPKIERVAAEKNYDFDDFDNQLRKVAEVLQERLGFVLLGDFSWMDKYDEKEIESIKRVKFLRENFDLDDPIRKKLNSGDSSWEIDLDAYLQAHNIIIK